MQQKKKKKIYLTQNEIQKLIDKKKDDVNVDSDLEDNLSELLEDDNQEVSDDLDQADQIEPTTPKKKTSKKKIFVIILTMLRQVELIEKGKILRSLCTRRIA